MEDISIKYFWKKEHFGCQERFNLLLLEPGEIYFEDFSAYYYPCEVKDEIMKKRQKGRLKVCSKSLVFDPLDHTFPIMKFLFKDILDIGKKLGIPIFSKVELNGAEVIQVESKNSICMKEGNIIAPYVNTREKKKYSFSLNFVSSGEVLPQIEQLLRAHSLNPSDSLYMVSAIVEARQRQMKFNASLIEDFFESIIHETTASKISPLVCNPGRILLSSKMIYFQPFNNIEAEPVLKILLSSIRSVVKRRYLLRHVGLELFLNGQGVDTYFIFSDQMQRDMMLECILKQEETKLENDDRENMTIRWQSGALSNFDYLLYLNNAADRSSNDLTQYPVFPWVVQDYSSNELDLENPCTFRDLSKPIGALDRGRLKQLKERSEGMPEPKFLYGSHYSSPGFVLYYLVRVAPEYMLCLQNGKFDKPDRLFNSFQSTWRNCCTGHSDFKELIPEFYCSDGSFLSNLRNLNLGTRQDNTRVNNVELPPWAKSPADFMSKFRQALECDHVSKNLHHWIDLIFGYKQRGQEAWDADNVFYYLTYEGAVDLDKIEDMNERRCYEAQILEFGQTPKQLFTKPHPKRHYAMVARDQVDTVPCVSHETEEPIPVIDLSDGGIPLTLEIPRTPFHWLSKLRLEKSVKLHKDAVCGCLLTDRSSNVFSVSQDTQLKMFSVVDEQHLRCMNLSSMALSCCCLSDDGKYIFIGSWDNNIYTYSVDASRVVEEKLAHDDAVSCLCYKNDILVSSSWDSTVKVWTHTKIASRKSTLMLLGELEHDTEVTSCDIVVSENCTLLLASATKDGLITIWDVDSLMTLSQFSNHCDTISQVLFSSDGDRVLSCGKDCYLKVVDVNTEVVVYSKHIGETVQCAVWDGHLVVAGGSSGDVMVWDLIKDACVLRLQCHKTPVTCVNVATEDRVMVTGSTDGYIAVWNV